MHVYNILLQDAYTCVYKRRSLIKQVLFLGLNAIDIFINPLEKNILQKV